MKWQPKSEDEIKESELCPEGKAPFTVLEASIVESKSAKNKGKEMLKLKLNVHADDGYDYHVYDYTADWFMEHKFRNFFFCIGAGKDYEAGTVDPANLIGREGFAEVTTQPRKGEFGPKSIISNYVNENEKPKAVAPDGAVPAQEEDDVPF